MNSIDVWSFTVKLVALINWISNKPSINQFKSSIDWKIVATFIVNLITKRLQSKIDGLDGLDRLNR